MRILPGPPQTCNLHPWDAMILRDCQPNTNNVWEVERIASKSWDILLVKMCEDYDCTILSPYLPSRRPKGGITSLLICNLPAQSLGSVSR